MAESKSVTNANSFSMVKYFKETVAELKKVVWPTRKQLTVNTVIVILASIFMAFFIAGTDFGLTQIVDRLLFGN